MIHEASCKIEIPIEIGKKISLLTGAPPPIPSDEEIEDTFPEWVARGKIFLARCFQEEGKSGFDQITQQDMFKYGMKFVICEAKKLM